MIYNIAKYEKLRTKVREERTRKNRDFLDDIILKFPLESSIESIERECDKGISDYHLAVGSIERIYTDENQSTTEYLSELEDQIDSE